MFEEKARSETDRIAIIEDRVPALHELIAKYGQSISDIVVYPHARTIRHETKLKQSAEYSLPAIPATQELEPSETAPRLKSEGLTAYFFPSPKETVMAASLVLQG